MTSLLVRQHLCPVFVQHLSYPGLDETRVNHWHTRHRLLHLLIESFVRMPRARISTDFMLARARKALFCRRFSGCKGLNIPWSGRVVSRGDTKPKAKRKSRINGPSPYLHAEDIVELLGCSGRTVGEFTRKNQIPHRKPPGGRRCLFLLDEITAWIDGAELEVVELERGGRIVKPVSR